MYSTNPSIQECASCAMLRTGCRYLSRPTNKLWHAALKTLELLATREAALPISAWLGDDFMKTKPVTLYLDVYPGWHEHASENVYLCANSKPYDPKTPGTTRIKISVELPCIEREYSHDDTAKAEAQVT